jgi:soluble lytic murein transglycosylase-like protein
MNIKVLQYIDNTPKNNITTGQAAVTGDNVPSNSSSTVNSTGADFDQVLDDAKMAEAAVAIDRLIAQSSGGSVDMSLVQRFFDQNGINIELCSSTAPQSAAVNNTVAYSGSSAINSSSVKLEASGLSCSAQLDAIFNEAASKYGVDAKFLKAIAKCESDFSTECTSRSGAMGIMQLMPQTAASLGVTNAYDPYQNIMGGARYISEKLTQYNGDKSLALAAYNAGSGNVAKYGGIPPFKETQNYVAKVMAYYNS